MKGGIFYFKNGFSLPLFFVLAFVVFISCKPQNKEIDSGDDWRDSFSPTPEALKSKIAISCKNIPTDGLMVALTFGQSNHGNHGGTPRSASGNVYEFYDGKCYPAKEPLFGATGNKGSVWTRLGDKIILTKLYDNVLFVSRAYGGTKIEQWKCGSFLSGKVIGSIRELRGKNIKLSHLLWHQGEVDNTEQTSRKDYKINFHEMLSCIRKETDAPIYVSVASYDGRVISENIRMAQKELVDIPNKIYPGPDTDTLKGSSRGQDTVHFSNEGWDKFADLWLEKLKLNTLDDKS